MDDNGLARIIAEAQRGDPAAHEALVDRYAKRLYGFFYRVLGQRNDAEDLMQEVFLRVVRMIAAYRDDGRFEPWLFRIAANLARDRIRTVRRTPTRVALDNDDGEGPSSFDAASTEDSAPHLRMEREEESDRLNAALAQLPEWEREVVMLRHFSQLSFKEIADLMGTPLGTALARAHRGLERLRQIMEGTGMPGGAESPEGRFDPGIAAEGGCGPSRSRAAAVQRNDRGSG